MFRKFFEDSGIFNKLLLLFFVFFTFLVIGLGVVTLVFGNQSDIHTLKINQLLLSVFTLLLPPLICGYLWYEKPLKTYSLHILPSLKITLGSLFLLVVIIPFINLLGYINEQVVLPSFLKGLEDQFILMETRAEEFTRLMLSVDTVGGLMLNLIVMAVVPALSEELFCRGALFNIFSSKINKYVSIWIVAIIFSLIHFQMYGFLPRMVYGAILGYLLVWSRSLWLPILIHFANNAIVLLVSFFGTNNIISQNMENLGKAETFGYGILSAVTSWWVIWIIFKMAKTDNAGTNN